MGDPSGIGPEVLASALGRLRVKRALTPIVFGDASFASPTPAARMVQLDGRIERATVVEVTALGARDRRLGKPTVAGGRAQLAYVDAAIAAAKAGRVDAICTAPVSKEQISRAGIPFMGHTERLAEAFGVEVLMLMDGPRLRVALATNHLPIKALSAALTVEGLARQIQLLAESLSPSLGRKARISVLGLNPHAGEGGLLGDEEIKVIGPAVALAKKRGVLCAGPFPADGLLAKATKGGLGCDAVLAMFHDQALPVSKALDFERTVNVTLGLPIPRTSPDHGVAYDIAGKGVASDLPMVEALMKAAELASVGR